MSNVKIINLSDVSIYLMEHSDLQINEYINKLNPSELERFKTIKHPLKKTEYAASRYLKNKLFGNEDIYYDDSGTPYLEKSGYLSISHSHKYVAIGTCDAFRIGIDIERIDEKAKTVQRRFVNEEEALQFDCTSDKDMTLLWSFKETLYKLSDRNQLIFKTDLPVFRTNNGHIGKVLMKSGFKETNLQHVEFDGFLITCNTDKLR